MKPEEYSQITFYAILIYTYVWTMTVIVFSMAGIIDWSWQAMFAPIWIPTVVVVVTGIVRGLFVAGMQWYENRKNQK